MNNKQQSSVDKLWDDVKGWIPQGQYAGVREYYLEAIVMHKDEIEEAELRGKEIIIIKHTENLTPIELPSDDEIKKEMEYDEFDPYDVAYFGGISYMRDLIQGGNNEQSIIDYNKMEEEWEMDNYNEIKDEQQ